MGLVYTEIEVGNARRDDLQPMEIRALVDSGAMHLCLPRGIVLQLDLKVLDQRTITYADGRSEVVDYVGPVSVRFANRRCLVGALVTGDQALLGAIPMEDMDLVINPARQAVAVNPAHPNIAASVAMGFRTKHND
jgi:clan AA aspartic protease